MKPAALLIILGMLPFLAWGGVVGPTKAKTVVESPRLLLRLYNGEQGTLIAKTVRITIGESGNPDKPACSETVLVAQAVRRGASKDMDLLPLDRLTECALQAGYRLPTGARAVEANETPVCIFCAPPESGGGPVATVPFSVRLETSCPGTIQEFRSFTNYLFFQAPPRVRPILLQ